MSPPSGPLRGWAPGFPRVSGDEPTVTYITDTNAEFSPRERG